MDGPGSLPTLPEPPSPLGTLVGQNGRHHGTRRLLQRPLTLLGQSHGCDIRLTDDGIAPLHCIIVQDADGPLLRDLDSGLGTKVNGQNVQIHSLANGDLIELGSVIFAVELETPPTSEGANAETVLHERDREALRIQAAAVAAQQVALTDEEARLDQRSTALKRQETQLAGHLEERQQQLDSEEVLLRLERDTFEAEVSRTKESLANGHVEFVQQRREIAEQRQQVDQQRQRLNELRRKLWKRYERHWSVREAALNKRDADLNAEKGRLQKQQDSVRAFQQRLNGELELGRREIRAEAQELALTQQRWHETQEQERQEQYRKQTEFDKRVADLSALEKAMAVEQTRWRQEKASLERECQALQTRVRHQREQLEALQRGNVPPALPPVIENIIPLAPMTEPATKLAWPVQIQELAGRLDDQRLHLAEQWQRLLDQEKHWQEERLTALGELEASTNQLAGRERELNHAEQRMRKLLADLEQRQEHLTQSRHALEGWQARFALDQSQWQAQREQMLGDLDERESILKHLQSLLEDEQETRESRLADQMQQLSEARARCEEARKQYSQQWHDCEQLRGELADQERLLNGEALALEQLREELIHSAPNSAKTASRLEKLSQREVARLDAEGRALTIERERLIKERARLDEDTKRIGQQEQGLLMHLRDWSRQVAEWEKRRASLVQEEARREQEHRRLQAQHLIDERQVKQLREELERLARVLIEDAPEAVATPRAA